jgi:FkbM family methyltransferase
LGESRDMRFVLAYLEPGDLFVDVGANVGIYTLLASSVRDVTVESFEPSPEAFSRLVENVELNNLGAHVAVHRAAAGEEDGTALLTQGRDCWNHLTSQRGDDAIEVPLLRLDSILPSARRRVALIKIDVEGRERDVLSGAVQTLRTDRPALIVEGDWDSVAAILEPLGYETYDYHDASRVLESSQVRHGNNLLAIADLGEARKRLIN